MRPVSADSLTNSAKALTASRRLSPTTVDVEGWWTDDLEADGLGKIPARKVTTDDLAAWSMRSKRKWAAATYRNRCIWLNQVLAFAGATIRVDVPPRAEHTRRPMSPRERDIYDTLTPPQPWMITALRLMRGSGLRRSEAFGLRHEDRDGDGVWINRSVLLAKKQIVVRGKGKGAKSRAWVALPPDLLAIIGHGQTGFVIGGKNHPMNPGEFSHWLYDAKQNTDLARIPYMGSHAVRRTYGMQLLESGADLITAAELMRHDPTMLAKEYARSREDLKRAAVARAFTKLPQETAPESQRSAS